MSERIYIFDTTLRDGEQSPGATMTPHEKLQIERQLEKLGVDVIEAGFPASSEGDQNDVRKVAKEIKDSRIACLTRAVASNIETAWRALESANLQGIHTFIATSDIHLKYKLQMSREEVVDRVGKVSA